MTACEGWVLPSTVPVPSVELRLSDSMGNVGRAESPPWPRLQDAVSPGVSLFIYVISGWPGTCHIVDGDWLQTLHPASAS